MAEWVRLCAIEEAPGEGEVAEFHVEGKQFCLARIGGALHAVDNLCPHRQGPLGQGWVEGDSVLCPWHAWAFNVHTGDAAEPERAHVAVYPVRNEGDGVLVDLA